MASLLGEMVQELLNEPFYGCSWHAPEQYFLLGLVSSEYVAASWHPMAQRDNFSFC